MAEHIYVGVSGRARRARAIYAGVSGRARRVYRAYIGVGGTARQCYFFARTGTVIAGSESGAILKAVNWDALKDAASSDVTQYAICNVGERLRERNEMYEGKRVLDWLSRPEYRYGVILIRGTDGAYGGIAWDGAASSGLSAPPRIYRSIARLFAVVRQRRRAVMRRGE